MDVRENGCKQFVSYFSMPVGSSLPIFQVRYKCYYLLQCFKFSSVSGSGSGKVRRVSKNNLMRQKQGQERQL